VLTLPKLNRSGANIVSVLPLRWRAMKLYEVLGGAG
jgi:hypothetical protein